MWSAWILAYSRAHRLWRLKLADALDTELFYNRALGRRLKAADAADILDAMVRDGSLEWADREHTAVIVFWRRPTEWAGVIYDWVFFLLICFLFSVARGLMLMGWVVD